MAKAACAIVTGWLVLLQVPQATLAMTPEVETPNASASTTTSTTAPTTAATTTAATAPSVVKVKPLQGALASANAAIRRGSKAEASPESLALTELAGELSCEVAIASAEPSDTGETTARATLLIHRSVSVQSKDSEDAIRGASNGVSAARAAGERALRDFEKSWEPVKSDRTKYIRTHWGGCRKFWPRISATEYQNRRNDIIEKNKAAIANATDNLETVRDRVRSEQNKIIQAAKTVQLLLKPGSDASAAAALREGERVKLVLRVEKVELATDPEVVRNPASYVSTVHASIVTIAAAR